jgi:hypothetical protein
MMDKESRQYARDNAKSVPALPRVPALPKLPDLPDEAPQKETPKEPRDDDEGDLVKQFEEGADLSADDEDLARRLKKYRDDPAQNSVRNRGLSAAETVAEDKWALHMRAFG